MNANVIIGITAALVGCVVGLVIYMQQGKGADYLARSKWDITIAEDGTAQTWYVDVASESIRVETVDDDGQLRVQEFIEGRMYDFALAPLDYEPLDVDAFCTEIDDVDCEALAAQLAEDNQALWEADVGTKHECNVEDFVSFASSEAVVANGKIVVGGFHVLMTDGVPTAIMDEEGSTIATINSIEDWAGELDISGCTVDEDDSRKLELFEIIGESRRRRTTVDPAAEAAREHLNGVYMEFLTKNHTPEEAEEAGRHLGFAEWMSYTVSKTNYCGAGSDILNLPCPSAPAAKNLHNLGDSFNVDDDAACRRHDHGAKHRVEGAYVVLGCDIDADLYAGAGSNLGVSAVFGPWGLAQLWGCFDTVKSCRWKSGRKWWHLPSWTCDLDKLDGIRRWPGRYDDIRKRYGYKTESAQPKICETDRYWWKTDGQCANKCGA